MSYPQAPPPYEPQPGLHTGLQQPGLQPGPEQPPDVAVKGHAPLVSKQRLLQDLIRTRTGIMRVAEVALCLCTMISTCAYYWYFPGQNFTRWAAIISMASTNLPGVALIVIIIYTLLDVLYRAGDIEFRIHPVSILIETSISCVFFFVAFICCAVSGWRHSSIVAACIFSLGALVVFALDTFFQIRDKAYRLPPSPAGAGRPTTTVTAVVF